MIKNCIIRDHTLFKCQGGGGGGGGELKSRGGDMNFHVASRGVYL